MKRSKIKAPLDQEEKDLIKAFDSVDVTKIEPPSETTQNRFKKAAANSMKKEAKMNIRIASKELEAIKQRAAEEGLNYQPFVRSVLHKYVTGQLIEKSVR